MCTDVFGGIDRPNDALSDDVLHDWRAGWEKFQIGLRSFWEVTRLWKFFSTVFSKDFLENLITFSKVLFENFSTVSSKDLLENCWVTAKQERPTALSDPTFFQNAGKLGQGCGKSSQDAKSGCQGTFYQG